MIGDEAGYRSVRGDDRSQAHTLEAVVGAVLLLTAIAFALQVTIVTPLSASTSSQHIEGQQRAVAQGVLANAAEDSTLQNAVLYYNESGDRFHDTEGVGFYTEAPDNDFGDKLARAFDEEGIAYNVIVKYQSQDGLINEKAMVLQGTPSDNAVSATRTLTLRNDAQLVDENRTLNGTTIREADLDNYIRNGPADYAGSDGHGLYNVVTVEVVAWRI